MTASRSQFSECFAHIVHLWYHYYACPVPLKYSTSTLNDVAVSRYATQGKCPLGKVTH